MKVSWDFKEFENFAQNLTTLTKLEKNMTSAAKRLAKALLRWMKEFTPVDEYTLINGWDGNNFAVKKTNEGFEVLIVNRTEYAAWVNDGHKAYNQFGGSYKIHNRVQVGSPYQWQKGSQDLYVFGHFFVERGILRLHDTSEIEQIIFDELQKWWDSV